MSISIAKTSLVFVIISTYHKLILIRNLFVLVGNDIKVPIYTIIGELIRAQTVDAYHSLWIQTLSEKVLKPPNYSKIYPSHTSFQKVRLDP